MKILVIGQVNEEGLKHLHEHFEVTHYQEKRSREETLTELGEYDGVLLRRGKADKVFIDAGKKLKIISNYGAGYNHIDAKYAREKGILVTNTPDAVRTPTAETTLLMILGSVRRYEYYRNQLHQGVWPDSSQPENLSPSLEGATVGIVGFGSIGQDVARLLQPFNVDILYYQRNQSDAEKEYQATYVDFDTLLQESDIITVHVPLTDETYHMFDADAFNKMKSTAHFINMARGPVHDETALVEALKTGQIAGAGIDVFEDEPRIHPDLLTLDNAFIAPHIGTSTHQARLAMTYQAADNIISYLVDGIEKNRVN